MDHATSFITTLVTGIVLAFVFGIGARHLRLSPIVGYLLAGVLCGPYTPGFIADTKTAQELAEVGIILLMFGVGMHFSPRELMSVRNIAVPGAVAQIAVATILGFSLGMAAGFRPAESVLFGLSLSVASTVVLIRALEDRRILATMNGRIAVGWLLVEDIAMVMVLVLIPALMHANGYETGIGILVILLLTLGKIALFGVLMLVVGFRVLPPFLIYVARLKSPELFTLSVLAVALGVAYIASEWFGASFALGAFLAGLVLGKSEIGQKAAEKSLPLREAFAVLFFVSVGMLFDPAILLTDPLLVLGVVLTIMVGKSLAALAIILLFRHPLKTGLVIAASLAQIGEFSFILAGLGLTMGILSPAANALIMSGALISIALNPFFFRLMDRLDAGSEKMRL